MLISGWPVIAASRVCEILRSLRICCRLAAMFWAASSSVITFSIPSFYQTWYCQSIENVPLTRSGNCVSSIRMQPTLLAATLAEGLKRLLVITQQPTQW